MSYTDKMFKVPMLTMQEERELILNYKNEGCQKSKDKLLAAFMKMVISMAYHMKRNYKSPIDVDDLISEGSIGLVLALDRFNEEYTCDDGSYIRFGTYSKLWVKACMMTAVMNCYSSVIKVSSQSTFKTIFYHLNKKMKLRGFEYPLNREEMEVLAEDLKVSADEISVMEKIRLGDLSLNAPMNKNDEDSSEFMDTIAVSNDHDDVFRNVVIKEMWNIFDSECGKNSFNDRERLILSKRTYAQEPLTLDQIARQMGITKERVRQIETRANEKLIDRMKKRMKVKDAA